MVVGIYILLGALCLWGAIAWNSLFMLVLAGVWWYVAALCVLWFYFGPKEEEDDPGTAG